MRMHNQTIVTFQHQLSCTNLWTSSGWVEYLQSQRRGNEDNVTRSIFSGPPTATLQSRLAIAYLAVVPACRGIARCPCASAKCGSPRGVRIERPCASLYPLDTGIW